MATILVVEDEPEIRYALSRVLVSAGHEVTEVERAEDCALLLNEQRFDLMICDLQLAHDQARQVLAQARPQAAELAVLAITGGGLAASASNVERAKALGASVILHKPFDSETLIAVAERLLESQTSAGREGWRLQPDRGQPSA